MREMHQLITGKLQFLLLQKVQQADFAFVHGFAKLLQGRQTLAADNVVRACFTSQQDTAFFECFANCADLCCAHIVMIISAAQKRNERVIEVLRVSLTAGKYQRA